MTALEMRTLLDGIGIGLVVLPAALAAYAFVIYPALLWLASRFRPPINFSRDPEAWPTVTLLIVAYNEAHRIVATIERALAVDYPPELLDILVMSDASSDGTDELVEGLSHARVRLVRMPYRMGKAAGENASADYVTGIIVVSIDASILIAKESLKALVRAMMAPNVGLASGRDISVGDARREGNQAESSYVDLEMRLRSLETRVGSIVGASGCFYATRRDLHRTSLPIELSRDFAAASRARAQGYRAVSVDEALCYVPRTTSLKAELRRKSRTMGRGLDTLLFFRTMMNPFRYGSFAFMMVSHKLVRWLLFPSLLGWVIGPLFLLKAYPWSGLVLGGMLTGLLIGLVSVRWPSNNRLPSVLAFPSYVFVSIMAGWLAWWHLIVGQKSAIWEPTQRPNVHSTL